MNILELYKLWDQFKSLMDDPSFEATVKHEMAGDLIRGLPPVMLCQSFESSRKSIESAMKGRLGELKVEKSTEERDGRTQSKEGSQEAGAKGVQRKTRSREKSI